MNYNEHALRLLAEAEQRYPAMSDCVRRISLLHLLELQGERANRKFQEWKAKANCCGTTAFCKGIVRELTTVALEIGHHLFTEIPEENDFPGYISPNAGDLFLKRHAPQTNSPQPGDLIAFWKSRGLTSLAVYLGETPINRKQKRLMFHKPGQEGDFLFQDLDYIYAMNDIDDLSFHRINQ